MNHRTTKTTFAVLALAGVAAATMVPGLLVNEAEATEGRWIGVGVWRCQGDDHSILLVYPYVLEKNPDTTSPCPAEEPATEGEGDA
ncbi:MAG TPA: hypothetical protein VM681_11105 [Candidatus Thermoplasmatota archaeon]|nr:hypothetical protein [Candidatus Thermoplasmatota archaeon]